MGFWTLRRKLRFDVPLLLELIISVSLVMGGVVGAPPRHSSFNTASSLEEKSGLVQKIGCLVCLAPRGVSA